MKLPDGPLHATCNYYLPKLHLVQTPYNAWTSLNLQSCVVITPIFHFPSFNFQFPKVSEVPDVLYNTSKHSMSSTASEKDDMHSSARLEAQPTNDSSQPGMPIYHRRLANPAPLGLLSFATSVFLVSLTGMGTRGVKAPNIIITTMIFFGGICQYIAGIMEFVTGNTVGPILSPVLPCATLITG